MFFFFQAEDGIRDLTVTGVQTCALPILAITKWAQGAAPEPAASGHSRRLTVRFWLRPTEILGTERVEGLTLERTAISPDGKFGGTGVFETLDAQMVLRSVGYQSVPLPGVLAGRGIVPVSYAEWLRIETAEADLAKALVRGERVKLHNAEAIWSACRPLSE